MCAQAEASGKGKGEGMPVVAVTSPLEGLATSEYGGMTAEEEIKVDAIASGSLKTDTHGIITGHCIMPACVDQNSASRRTLPLRSTPKDSVISKTFLDCKGLA
jgi:hypothetical protein